MINQTNKLINRLVIFFSLVTVTVILLFPVFFGRVASFCVNHDNRHQAYPFFNKLAIALHKGYLPVWDANTYGGKNFVGEFQAGAFYPLNIAWCFLFGSANGIDVYYLDLLVAIHYLICLVGMYCLGRILKFSRTASVAAGLIFTFTGIVGARSGAQTCIFNGLTLLPWAMYFLFKYYISRKKRRYLVFAGLINGLEILGGHMQPFFHSILISGIIILFYEYMNRKDLKSFVVSSITGFLIVLLVAIVLALPQIYYGLEYLSQSYRWVGAADPVGPGQKVPLDVYLNKNIITPSNFFNLFGPHYAQPEDDNILYMGILPLFIFVIFLVKYASFKMDRGHILLRRALLIILVTSVLSFLGYLTFFPKILYHIPFVNAVRELGRYSVMFSFAAALLAGLAITYITQLKEILFQHSSRLKFYILLILAINMLYLIKTDSVPAVISVPILLAMIFFLLLKYLKNPMLISMVALACIFGDLYLNRVNYTSTNTPFYPSRYYARNNIFNFLETTYGKYRVSYEMQNDDSVRKNIGDIYNIQTKLGFCATMNKPYFDFICYDWGLNSEVYNLLNIKYILTDRILDSSFLLKDSSSHVYLYERKNYYPRSFWKSQLDKAGPQIEEENKETIKQLEYSDEYQKYEINCAIPDTLIFSENNYPGWTCYDNGTKTTIVQPKIKNYSTVLRSVGMSKGHHIIEFKYRKRFLLF